MSPYQMYFFFQDKSRDPHRKEVRGVERQERVKIDIVLSLLLLEYSYLHSYSISKYDVVHFGYFIST